MKKKLSAVILCSLGIGGANLLNVKVRRLFPDLFIHGVYPAYRLDEALEKKPDLILATMPLAIDTIPVVQVSHVLYDREFQQVKRMLDELREIDFSENFFSSLFDKKIFIKDLDAKNSNEVIEKLSDVLLKANHVTENFVNLVKQREAVFSTAIGNGVAIPHALSDGNRSSIGVAILKNVIEWEEEKVQLVFLLNIRKEDIERVKPVFDKFYDLIESRSKVKQILKAEKFDSFMDLFSK